MSDFSRACAICFKNVKLSHYSRHVNTHNAKFQCSQCPSMPTFSRRDSLIRHTMKLHGNQCKSDDDKPTSHSIVQNSTVPNTPPIVRNSTVPNTPPIVQNSTVPNTP